MDNSQPDPTLPPTSLSGEPPSEGRADPAAEIAGMRDRLAFYETFDSLILENVRRSGELLRQVSAARDGVDQRLDAMRYQLEARLLQQRTVLEEVAASLSDLEQSLGSVASRVNQAVAGLSASSLGMPSTVPPSSRQMPSRDEAADADVAESGRAEESGAPPTPLDEAEPILQPPDLEAASLAEASALDELPREDEPTPLLSEDEPLPPVSEEKPSHPAPLPSNVEPIQLPSNEELVPLQPVAAEPDRLIVEPPADRLPRRVDLVVHGVPKAAAALSLQRHLQDLAGVAAVEVREYVSGVLRFQVMATSFAASDVQGWDGGTLETVTERADVVELRLQGADGV